MANQQEKTDLKLEGHATDHIWIMEDGPESHPIGIRLDCGDSGVVYLSESQAADLHEQLNDFIPKAKVGDKPVIAPQPA